MPLFDVNSKLLLGGGMEYLLMTSVGRVVFSMRVSNAISHATWEILRGIIAALTNQSNYEKSAVPYNIS
jgi:hypothetical protein